MADLPFRHLQAPLHLLKDRRDHKIRQFPFEEFADLAARRGGARTVGDIGSQALSFPMITSRYHRGLRHGWMPQQGGFYFSK